MLFILMLMPFMAQVVQEPVTLEWLVGVLMGAIAALAGFIVWLIKTRVPTSVYSDCIEQFRLIAEHVDQACNVLNGLALNQDKFADLVSISSQTLSALSVEIESLMRHHEKSEIEMRGAMERINEIKLLLQKHHEMYVELRRLNGIRDSKKAIRDD